MSRGLDIVILGLSLSSSWGNGHATTYRSLIPGLAQLGHRVLFLERDVPWYAANRDLSEPDYCELEYYGSLDALAATFAERLQRADAVLIGSYVPEGIAVIDLILDMRSRGVSFYDIDTPVTLARLAHADAEYLARRQIPRFDTYFSFAGGETLTRLEQAFGARRVVPLYCSVDPERYAPTGEAPVWDLGYLGTYSPDRQPALEELLLEPARRLPRMRFAVAGPQYPSDIAWPANVERFEHLPPDRHASFYSRQRFTLNVTRADMVRAGWSPSVRLFEAASVGTPILSDYWRGLDDILPVGEAVRVVERAEDVVLALTSLDEAARTAMAITARQIVHRNHTGLARARELEVELLRALESPAPLPPAEAAWN